MRRAVLCASLLLGCAVGPNFKRPAAPSTAKYTSGAQPTDADAEGRAQRFDVGRDVQAEWWHLFGSREIDALVKQALAHNPNLESARASLRRSQNAMRAGYGVFFPQVDVGASAAYQRFSALRFGSTQPPSEFALYTLTGTVTYLVDIWGGQRRQVESLSAQVDAQRYTLAGAYVMLCGNLVNAFIARAGYRAQIEATRALVELERDQVHITEVQAGSGTVPFSNVLALRAQLASTEALLPQLQVKSDQADDLIAALVGVVPGNWSSPDVKLAELVLPADVPVTLPSKLVRQRPDILTAEALLHSANAQIGVATAAMLPNLTLSATGGWNNTDIASLFDPNGLFWSLGGGITQPIFHGGTLWYQRKAAIEARNQALYDYQQTVLSAFQQVADTLRALEHDAQYLQAESNAVAASEQALGLMRANYQSGVASYVQVLIANAQYLQSKDAYLQAIAQRLQDTVALFVALGGGWWNAKSL